MGFFCYSHIFTERLNRGVKLYNSFMVYFCGELGVIEELMWRVKR